MKSLALALTLMAGSALLLAPARAADETWNGGDGDWNSANWSPDGVPPGNTTFLTNSDAANFNTGGVNTINIDANRMLRSLNFNSGAGSFTFNGGPLIISNGGGFYLNSGATGTITVNSNTQVYGAFQGLNFINNSASGTFNITGTLSEANTEFGSDMTLGGSNTGNNIISGVISNGSGSGINIVKNDAGTWILSAANTTMGDTRVNSGILQLDNTRALQFSNVNLNGTDGLAFGSSGTYVMKALSGSGTQTLASGVRLDVGIQNPYLVANTVYTFNGVLSGAGGLDFTALRVSTAGTQYGTQIFSQNQAYTGGTTVNGGILQSTSNVSGTPFGTGSVTITGGSLSLAPATGGAETDISLTGANATVDSTFTYNGGANLSLNKNGYNSLTYTIGNAGATSSILDRANNGTLIIQTASTDLGSGENFKVNGTAPVVTNNMVNASIIGFGVTAANTGDFLTYGANGFASAAGSYTPRSGTLGAGTTASTEITNLTGATEFTGDNTTYALLVQGTSATIDNGVTLTVGDNTAGHQAGIIMNGAGTNIGGGGTLNFGASEGIIYSIENPNYSQATIDARITGTGGLTISGVPTDSNTHTYIWLRNTNNTFSGNLTLNSGVYYNYFGSSNNGGQFVNGILGDPNNAVVFNGATMDSTGNFGSGAYVGVGRSFIMNDGGGTLTGSNNYVANISGTGGVSVGIFNQFGSSPANYGNNLTVLSGNNTFTGGLTLASGFTVVSSEANLGVSTGAITFNGGFLSIQGTSLHDFGDHQVTFVTGNTIGFDIENPNNTFTVSQALSQSVGINGALYKTGVGTLVLTGASTYQGTTGVFGGTLVVDASQGGSISSASSLFLDGGTLYVLGNTTGDTVQSFNNISMGINRNTSDATSGGGTIVVDSNTGDGSQTLTVNLGLLQTGNGGYDHYGNHISGDGNMGGGGTGNSLSIVIKGNGTSTVTTTTAPDGTAGLTGDTGIYGGRIVYTDASGNTNWATSNDVGSGATTFSITGYSDYINFNFDNGNGDPSNLDNTQLTGNSTLSGDTTVNTIKINNTSAATTMNLNGHTLSLNSGGLLFTGSTNYTISNGNLVSNLTGTVQRNKTGNDSSPGTDLIIQQYGTGTLTISANIADNPNNATGVGSTLTKAGPGTLVLTGLNTYTGQTFVNGGVLSVSSVAVLDNSGNVITPGNISGFRINLNGGTLQATASIVTPQIYLGPNGGGLDAVNGSVIDIQSQIGTYIGNGNPGVAHLTVNSSDNSGGVIWLDNRSNLNGNVFYGGITIAGGTLRISSYGGNGDTAATGADPANYIDWTDSSNGVLQLNGVSTLVSGLSSTSTNAVVENGNGNSNNVLIGVSNGDDETFAGRLVNALDTSTGTLGLFKAGAGTLSLTNINNSYTGKTEIDGGILNVALITDGGLNSSIGASSNAATNIAFGGGTLQYTGSTAQSTDRLFTLGDAYNALNNTGASVGGNNGAIDASGSSPSATLSFTNTGSLAYNNVGTHSLTFTGTNTGANTFAPLIGDSSSPTSVSKTGSGTWVITNANTYSGGTSVTAGTLYVNNASGSGLGVGSVAVSSTGTLAGTGAIQPGVGNALLVSAGGTVAPGGIQPAVPYEGIAGTTANGNLTLNTASITAGGTIASFNNAKLSFTLGAGNVNSGSKLVIAGDVANIVSFGGTSYVTINDLVGSGLTIGEQYVLIAGDNTTFSGLTVDGTGLITSGLQLLYDNTPGNNYFSDWFRGSQLYVVGDNIVLDVAPEPSTWALMLGGLVMLFFVRRRRATQTKV